MSHCMWKRIRKADLMGADEQKDIEEQEAMSGHKAIDGTLIVTLPHNASNRVVPQLPKSNSAGKLLLKRK